MNGEAIREARIQRGWSQSELGRRVGRSQATISAVESGRAVSRVVLEQLAAILTEAADEPAPRELPEEPRIRFRLPDLSLERAELSLPITATSWNRPEQTSDFLMLIPLALESVLVAAVDVAGHGTSAMPTRLYLQGWLRGWARSQSSPPRLQTLIQEFSRELRSARVDASCYFALLSRERQQRHTISYEALAYGFPAPLLISGPPIRTRESAGSGPPLPTEDFSASVVRIERLCVPWRLVIASDGLIRRLGAGSEARGLQWLREWQSGPKRNVPPEASLGTPDPVTDDESFLLLEWDLWDETFAFSISDDIERHRTVRLLGQKIQRSLGSRHGLGLQQALVEALSNVGRHAYRGRGGMVKIHFREEEKRWRLEVEDEGEDRTTDRDLRKPQGGFALMRHWSDHVDVRKAKAGGTVVSLLFNKEGAREADGKETAEGGS